MLKNIPREHVLQIVKQKGPTIPTRIVKELGGDTFLIGAILSDLLKNNLLKYTHLKLGGTPFYYAPEQKHKLVEISQHLKGKEKSAYEMLKNAKLLKDEDQEPATRVALRMIKDFAKPIEVKIGAAQELFWKFFLVSNEEVKEIIKNKFLKKTVLKAPEEKRDAVNAEIPVEDSQKTVSKEDLEKTEQEFRDSAKDLSQRILKKDSVLKDEKISILKEDKQNPFSEEIQKYFKKKNIEVLEKNQIRKTELDYVIRVPTSIGTLEYYCKAKDKRKCNDGDLATAFIQGQTKKLPVLFLTTGEVTKKAKKMLHKEFKGLTVDRI